MLSEQAQKQQYTTVNMPGKFANIEQQMDAIHCLTSMKTQMETSATILARYGCNSYVH